MTASRTSRKTILAPRLGRLFVLSRPFDPVAVVTQVEAVIQGATYARERAVFSLSPERPARVWRESASRNSENSDVLIVEARLSLAERGDDRVELSFGVTRAGSHALPLEISSRAIVYEGPAALADALAYFRDEGG